MKAWQWALVGTGVVVGVVIIAKVATASTDMPVQYQGPHPGPSGADTGDAASRAVSGGFGLGTELLRAIAGKVQRDDEARERQRERDEARRERDEARREREEDSDTVTDPTVKARLLGRQ